MRVSKVLGLAVSAALLGVSSLSFSFVEVGPIKAGDSFWKIAKAHHVAHVSTTKMVHAIQALNPSLKKLKVGGKLKVPTTLEEVHTALGQSSDVAAKEPASSVQSAAGVREKSASKPAVKAEGTSAVQPAPVPEMKLPSPETSTPTSLIPPATGTAQASKGTTQLLAPAVLATQTDNAEKTVVKATDVGTQAAGSSVWAWVWFIGLIAVLGFGWKNRYKLFERLRGGKDIAARRLGLHRAEHEQAFDTNPLWTQGKPSYDESQGERDGMADAMIQMARGEYSEAKKILSLAIEKEPQNIELRMKLLEVSVALDDRELFKVEADYLLEHLMDQADPRWGKIKNMYLRKWAYDVA